MKKIVSIGFALLMIFAVFVPFVSAYDNPTQVGYTSVVNPNPAGDGGNADGMGQLAVNLLCRSPQIGGEFSIVPVVATAPFTNDGRVDLAFIDQYVKVVGTSQVEQFLPDGTFDMRLAPGNYMLKLFDGNGGQPEYALVKITAGNAETVSFQGHGISGITPAVANPVITVTEATYGATRVVIDQAAVPGVPAVPEISHVEGAFVDVKAQVQANLYNGVQNIVFDNAANPGGIFDTAGHLLTQIIDPAYGQLKTATIKYTVDGGAVKTVSGQEHQTISLV